MSKNDVSPSLRHGAMDRLRFIEARLFWEARINRADLIDAYGVSPAQAAIDFKEYLKFAGPGVAYDGRLKAYVTTEAFHTAFGEPDAGAALMNFAAEGDPLLARLPTLERPLDPFIAARMRLAAKNAERVRVVYQSFTNPELKTRWIAPARLVSDGERWHARCYCYEHAEWRDFVLARIASIQKAEPAGNIPEDREWASICRLVLKPSAKLSEGQKATVIREYAMKAGRLVVAIPRAMRIYAIRRWGLDRDTTRLDVSEDC